MNIAITQHTLWVPLGHLLYILHKCICTLKFSDIEGNMFFKGMDIIFGGFDIWVNILSSALLFHCFFAQVSDGQRMERSLTQAVSQSWRFLSALAHFHSTHSVTPWTAWSSTRPNTSAMHPTCSGQPSLMRPASTLMVRTCCLILKKPQTSYQERVIHFGGSFEYSKDPSCVRNICCFGIFCLERWITPLEILLTRCVLKQTASH